MTAYTDTQPITARVWNNVDSVAVWATNKTLSEAGSGEWMTGVSRAV